MKNRARHKEQAAALLAEAEAVVVLPDPGRSLPEREQAAQRKQGDLRFEALIHAVLYVGDQLDQTGTAIDDR